MDSIVVIPLPAQSSCPDGGNSPWPALPEFLAGPENHLLEPAVHSLLADPPNGYNPLLFCGPSGAGKSHLASGLAAWWIARYPRRRALHTSADEFARELTDAIDTQATDEVRGRYRRAALLVLEGVCRLAGRPDVQEELVQTLDALLAGASRVVLTASAAPGRLAGLMPRLQSRLDSGLTVPVAPPGPAARLAILQRSARLRGLDLSESAGHILADCLSVTVAGLLDALDQLELSVRPGSGKIGDAEARRLLALRGGSSKVGLQELVTATARMFALKPAELRSPSRRQAVAGARAVAMYLARQLTNNSLQQLGRYFGGRDRTTVTYGCRKAERLLENDSAVRRIVRQLQERLQHR